MRLRLLNPGDWFVVQELCEGEPRVSVAARIDDQSHEMEDLDRLKAGKWVSIRLANDLEVACAALVGIYIATDGDVTTVVGVMLSALLAGLTIGMLFAKFWRDHQGRRADSRHGARKHPRK